MSEYKPGTYVKDGLPPREALTSADAVALVFDGYKLDESSAEEAPAGSEQPSEEPEATPPGQPAPEEAPQTEEAPKSRKA